MDSPSDISLLKGILKELDLPAEEIVDKLENVRGDEEDEEIDGLEPNPEQEKEEEEEEAIEKGSRNIDCVNVDEKGLAADLIKRLPHYSEEQINDLVQDVINSQCKLSVKSSIKSNDWVINKKGKINYKQLDLYTNQILGLTKNVSQEDRKTWVDYLNNPSRHVTFTPTIGAIGNLKDDLNESGLPEQIILNLLRHTGMDSGGKGVGAGEFGMSLIFSNIKASVAAGDLVLDGKEFEIKGQNATLGKRPDEVNALSLNKLAEFIDELDGSLVGDDNIELKPVNVIDQDNDIKLQFKKPEGARTNILVYKNKEYKHTEFAAIISDIYKKTPNKEEFKEAFKVAIGAIESAKKQMHAEAVEQFWPEMSFDTSKEVQDSIALLNFYRYILKEGFTKFLAHDIGAEGKGIGNYVYAEGDPMKMTKDLIEAGATFQAVKPTNMKPRIGFGGSFREEVS
tara:strand:- start:46 stop:1404 length:1359 start_codon:yes stop_codon:yes gene_type:complete